MDKRSRYQGKSLREGPKRWNATPTFFYARRKSRRREEILARHIAYHDSHWCEINLISSIDTYVSTARKAINSIIRPKSLTDSLSIFAILFSSSILPPAARVRGHLKMYPCLIGLFFQQKNYLTVFKLKFSSKSEYRAVNSDFWSLDCLQHHK